MQARQDPLRQQDRDCKAALGNIPVSRRTVNVADRPPVLQYRYALAGVKGRSHAFSDSYGCDCFRVKGRY
jgi:hypothetical protein